MASLEADMNKITLKEFEISNTSSGHYPGTTPGETWTTKDFEKRLRVDVVRKEGMELEFDLVGVDTSLANALRRILISEVPTMAIEKVHCYNNTSIIQDEVFAHRLGLIPLGADPRLFEWKKPDTDDAGTEKDTLEFELNVKCSKRASTNTSNTDQLYVDKNVYSKHIRWVPNGSQAQWVKPSNPGPIIPDILLNKLLPGHELDMKLYAYKGVGRDHAKFSPVATAFYRLLPEIKLNRTVKGEEAERLQKCFSVGTIELEGPKKKAVVADARNDGCSRNVFRHEDLKDAVTLGKVRDHFIFTVESTGAVLPQDLFVQAIDVLEGKCDAFLEEIAASKTVAEAGIVPM